MFIPVLQEIVSILNKVFYCSTSRNQEGSWKNFAKSIYCWKTLLYVDRKSIDDIPAKKIMNDFFHNQPSAFLQKFHRKTHC